MIPRIDYIKKIKPFINVQLVKILPGVNVKIKVTKNDYLAITNYGES